MNIIEELANIANELDKRELRAEANAIDNVITRLAGGNVMGEEDDWWAKNPMWPTNSYQFFDHINRQQKPLEEELKRDRLENATMPSPHIDHLIDSLGDDGKKSKIDGPIKPFGDDADNSNPDDDWSDFGIPNDSQLPNDTPVGTMPFSSKPPLMDAGPDLLKLMDSTKARQPITIPPSQAALTYEKNKSFDPIHRGLGMGIDKLV